EIAYPQPPLHPQIHAPASPRNRNTHVVVPGPYCRYRQALAGWSQILPSVAVAGYPLSPPTRSPGARKAWPIMARKTCLLTAITYCNIVIAYCNMTLGEKMRYLREVEGTLRGMKREISQLELSRLVEKELGKSISQSYLSQIESGARPHLTNSTRMLLARFFKVHPGYLVDDPEGYQNELISDLGAIEDKLDLWLISGAERFSRDVDLHHG